VTPRKPKDTGQVLVFRNGADQPVAVPSDVVEANERPYRAHQLRTAGHTWEQVARIERYPSGSAAAADVRHYLDSASKLLTEFSQRSLLTLEIARLDALQLAIWPQATAGILPAVSTALQIVLTRARLLGLDRLAAAEPADTSARTVVIPDGAYAAELAKAAGHE
jgi:hypothetical protein